ncbi:ATP-binding protein [Candidatus Woesearchaeota archaeon]|nr:ATP-binding protein [Candidatus Woesearchaeota archaeon]
MDDVFDEWSAYAKRKELLARDVDLDKLWVGSRLKIMAITGIRRCGKTSVLMLLYQDLLKKGKKAGFVSLEDSRLNDPKTLNSLIKWFGDEGYLILDEVTSAKDWEGWLSRNHEMLKGKLGLIVSSSRSNLVVPNKPLRGRILSYEMYPLSFSEFLSFRGVKVEKTTAGVGRIEKQLEEYLLFGGFPEAVLLDDKTEKVKLLNSYFKDIIGLDVAEIAQENISLVDVFARYIVESPYFSASKCLHSFKSMGYKIAKQSLLRLERCSQEGYLFFFVPIFSLSIKDRAQYPRKSYLGDTGFAYSISGKIDKGRNFENTVFLHLKRILLPNHELNYWKNKEGQEVDFIIRQGKKIEAIYQVTYDLDNESTKNREVGGLVACAHEFNQKHGMIITKDVEKNETIKGVTIRFMPLWKFLLASWTAPLKLDR